MIAIGMGAVVAGVSRRMSNWPVGAAVALWPSFGGHWLEILFLNKLRPCLPASRAVQAATRLTVWFVGGMALAGLMGATAELLGGLRMVQSMRPSIAGVGFVGVELAAHLALQLRGRPSFYNGRG